MIRTAISVAACVLLLSCNGNSPPPPTAEPVRTTYPSGLTVEDLRVGTGDVADSNDFVTLHYTGYRGDGSVFETRAADEAPLTIQLTPVNVIPGWFEGIQGMRKGGLRRLTVPAHLAYGSVGIPGIIAPGETLTFDIELHEAVRPPEPWPTDADWVDGPDGARIYRHSDGTGPTPSPGDRVTFHYSGYLADGRVFDSSVYRGRPFQVRLGQGQLLPSLEDALLKMNTGQRLSILLPPHLGFGGQGSIPADATVRFDIELIRIDTP